jgi:hypothetical protein
MEKDTYDHIFTGGKESKIKNKIYQLHGYPKRYKYKNPRWSVLATEADVLTLIRKTNNYWRFPEEYVFKIYELSIETKVKPIKTEEIMLLKIKEGI